MATAEDALAEVTDGQSFAAGGFGLSGVPEILVAALHATGASGLTVVSDNCGVGGRGLGILPASGRIARVTGSH
ncbi:CoA-transferase, partial [Streptomyces carpinensis]